MKGALEVERHSQRELCEGNLEEGLHYWGPWKTCRRGSGDGHFSTWGLCWGTWKGSYLLGTLRDEGSSKGRASLCEGEPGGGSFTSELGGCVKEGFGVGPLCP